MGREDNGKGTTLLVLGNGFDRHCGLKSSYKNWRASRFNGNFLKLLKWFIGRQDDKGNHAGDAILKIVQRDYMLVTAKKIEQRLTAWDIILWQNRPEDGDWKGIEELIGQVLQVLADSNRKDDKRTQDIKGVLEIEQDLRTKRPRLYQYVRNSDSALLGRSHEEYSDLSPTLRLLAGRDRHRDIFLSKILECKDKEYGEFRKEWNSRDTDFIFEMMLGELEILEREFATYLQLKVDEEEEYKKTACWLLESLCGGQSENAVVMSFNYTEPFAGVDDCMHVHNVHGTLRDGNIIFGIDKQGNDDVRILPFTKTYRKLFNPSTSVLDDCSNVSTIRFYGHSLGEMDYSYFMAIFDSMDIYGGEVCLEFFYSVYGDEAEGGIQRKRFDEVTNLIDRYGQTLNNRQQGKNLMHRLMLEGRLKVGEIPAFDGWRVLYMGNRALLITEGIVAKMPYHQYENLVTWENCTLRRWLNDEFYEKLPVQIKKRVVEVTNQNPNNSEYGTVGGVPTRDKVFLLSIDEANRYFKDNNDRVARHGSANCWWWLRSPGYDACNVSHYDGSDYLVSYAANVNYGGDMYLGGDLVNVRSGGVRPALWLNL